MLVLPAVLAASSASAQVLFQDTFDRPDAEDINASTAGITNNTGTSFGYVENFAPDRSDIVGNTLRLANGPGTSNIFVDHNFTDAAILNAGGFSVSFDLTQFGSGVGGGFGAGFGIGMSRPEALDTGDAQNGDGSSNDNFKMQDGLQNGGNQVSDIAVSDFWIVLRQDGFLQFGSRGASLPFDMGTPGPAYLGGGAVFTDPDFVNTGTVRVDFDLASFDDGATVGYAVFFNDQPFVADGNGSATGTFTWTGSNQNYIGLDARDPAFVGIDNFTISTPVPEPTSLALLGLGGLGLLRRRK